MYKIITHLSMLFRLSQDSLSHVLGYLEDFEHCRAFSVCKNTAWTRCIWVALCRAHLDSAWCFMETDALGRKLAQTILARVCYGFNANSCAQMVTFLRRNGFANNSTRLWVGTMDPVLLVNLDFLKMAFRTVLHNINSWLGREHHTPESEMTIHGTPSEVMRSRDLGILVARQTVRDYFQIPSKWLTCIPQCNGWVRRDLIYFLMNSDIIVENTFDIFAR